MTTLGRQFSRLQAAVCYRGGRETTIQVFKRAFAEAVACVHAYVTTGCS